MTLLISVMLAVPLGVIAAWRVGSWIDRAVMGFAVFGFSVPGFVIGYVLIWLFAIELGWLPVQGYTPLAQGFWPWLSNILLPSVTLALAYMALIARITRASMLETLNQDYIRTAHAKGLATQNVLTVHALRNAAVPIVTVIGIGVALLIGGVVVTESVFAIPGLGRLTVDAILRRDYPVIQGIILVFSGAYVVVNLVVDMLYTVLDPADQVLSDDGGLGDREHLRDGTRAHGLHGIRSPPSDGGDRQRAAAVDRPRVDRSAVARNRRPDFDRPGPAPARPIAPTTGSAPTGSAAIFTAG